MPYIACSSESTEGFCSYADTTCSAMNTCRTCDTFAGNGGACSEIDIFPNATIAEYGSYNLFQTDKKHKIMAEIYARGPVAAGVDALPLLEYKGGIVKDEKWLDMIVNHVVSITGWGTDEDGDQYWIVRNSWGQFWGEMGYFRVEAGKNSLGIESEVAWATPGDFTVKNYPCYEDGTNCGSGGFSSQRYIDPSTNIEALQSRLRGRK